MSAAYELTIKPRKGWQPIDLQELWVFRELLGFLVWRDIKVRYKQTILGGLWAILQPLIGTIIFGVLFSKVAPIKTTAPYILFVYAGLVPWTFFANSLSMSSNSLIGSEQMIRKTYLPRVFLPLGAILALVLDMLIGFALMSVLLVYYHYQVTAALLWLPPLMLGCFFVAAGMGLTLSALNVRYRDVKYVVPFFTQMVFFLTPVIYPLSSAPPKLKIFLALNPMAGMIEGFRHVILGSAISGELMWTSAASATLLFIAGLFMFHRMERTFADVI